MEENVISSKKMTFKFIWHFILYSILLTIITGFIYSLLYGKINILFILIIETILSVISIFLATKLSLKDIFEKNKLKEEDKRKYKKNIKIFFGLNILITLFIYALMFAVLIAMIDITISKIQIAEGQDITSAIEQLKNIILGITAVCALIKSIMYIWMTKYQNKYIN